jgi:hypothetical protein
MFRLPRFFLSLSLLAVILTACLSPIGGQPAPSAPTPDMNVVMTQAVQTAMAGMITPTPLPTETPLPTATLPPRTPPALPPVFTTGILNPLDTPHTYIADTCQYLQDKWNPNNAAPGTVVIVIMLHGINKEDTGDPKNITVANFNKMMKGLKELGFEAINMTQLADFLYHNTIIPSRSVILIQDDRHYAENFNTHFRPYWEQWGWPVVNGYIAKDERPDLWAENAALAAEGWVDYQAHGVIHNIPMSDSSTDEFLTGELQGAITNFQKYFHKTPIAIIWPGGGFGARPVQFARKYGYQLGFTVNPRGPLMFNWIPLGDQADPQRPYYLPEGSVNDPLMTLPRYWPNQILPNLDTIRVMGNEAAAYAEQNRATELEYYDIVCAPTYGPIPTAP